MTEGAVWQGFGMFEGEVWVSRGGRTNEGGGRPYYLEMKRLVGKDYEGGQDWWV
jgi:hypothetical protein